MRHKKLFIGITAAILMATTAFADSASDLRTKFIAAAKTYLGIRYVYGGTTRSGLDCSGFVLNAARDVGISLPRTASAMYSTATRISDSERQPGDLIFFSVGSSITHVAIYLGDNQVIHCISDGPRTGVVISALSENYWKTHYHSAGRIIAATKSPSTVKTNTPSTTATTTTTTSTPTTSTYTPKKKKKKKAVCYWDFDTYFDWNFFTPNQYGFVPKGGSLQTEFRLNLWDLNPVVMVRYSYQYPFGSNQKFTVDNMFKCFSLPVCLSLHFNDYVSVYTGAVLSTGTVCPYYQRIIDCSKPMSPVLFPGIVGASFSTPSFSVGKTKISMVQDISFTWYKAAPNYEPLTLKETLAAGTSFQTGIKVTLPF